MKRDIALAVVVVAAILVACFGLAAVRPNVPLTPSQPFVESAVAGTPTTTHKAGKVVMHVNGEAITDQEFEAFAKSAPAEARAFYGTPQGRRALADELVKLKTLEQEAKRMGLANDPDVATQVDAVRAQILAGRALEKLVTAEVDKQVGAELEKEKQHTIGLRHIAFAYEGGTLPPRQGTKAQSEAEAMKKAEAAEASLRSGADFAKLAASESDDQQSAARGGSLGTAQIEMLPPEIAGVISGMKPGEISKPVKTQFAVHIFKVEPPSMDELRPALTQRMQQQAIQETVARLQRNAKVELDPKFFGPAQPPAGPKSSS